MTSDALIQTAVGVLVATTAGVWAFALKYPRIYREMVKPFFLIFNILQFIIIIWGAIVSIMMAYVPSVTISDLIPVGLALAPISIGEFIARIGAKLAAHSERDRSQS